MIDIEQVNHINDFIEEYLNHHNMIKTLMQFQQEAKKIQIPKILRNEKTSQKRAQPRMH